MATIQKTTDVDAATETALKLLEVLFDPDDAIAFRSIEMWSEGGKKWSQVDYDHTCGHRAGGLARGALRSLVLATYDQGTNLLFSVCPREGQKGYDLAWQIRTVRVLWADLDDCQPDEALERVRKAGLPRPTAVVSSGNGTHLYWKLSEPYLIDDVGPPPRVHREPIERDGKRITVQYYVEAGQKVYLDKGRVPRLTAKAHRIQNVVAGVAEAIGGDSVYDLARVMRLPGPPNRKDHRNATEPKPTRLVECDPTRVYPLSTSERFAKPTKEAVVAQMPLPRPKKSFGRRLLEGLDDRIAVCRTTEKGQRSEADFSLCCYAVRQGIPKDRVWQDVSSVGKFAEAGERYFDRTWEAAEDRVRVRKYERFQRQSKRGNERRGAEAGKDGDLPIIEIGDGQKVADVFSAVTATLLGNETYFSRADNLVAIRDDRIRAIDGPHVLAGELSMHVEFASGSDERRRFTAFPTHLGSAYLANPREIDRFQRISLFTRNPVYTLDWRLSEPGYDPQSGIYYAGPQVVPREDPILLERLLRDFCWRRAGDRTNYVAMLLTMILMPRFVGSKPGVLFSGNQSGVGKTVLSQIIARLRDGKPARTVTYNPNDEELEKRMGSVIHSGATTLILDNAKTRNGQPLSSPCFERCITDEILSFRLLTRSMDIAVENSLIFGITANAPDVCADILSRCCIVNLLYEGPARKRTFSMDDPEGYALDHRAAILGELVGMVERWRVAGSPLADIHTRFNKKGWGPIVGGILRENGLPGFMENVEEAEDEMDDTRREFGALVEALVECRSAAFTATELAQIADRERLLRPRLGDGNSRSKATKIGLVASAYDRTTFTLSDGRRATFQKRTEAKRTTFVVDVEDEATAACDF